MTEHRPPANPPNRSHRNRQLESEPIPQGLDADVEKRVLDEQVEGEESEGTRTGTPVTETAASSSTVPLSAKALTLAPDDPLNPRNWSTSKKVLVNFVLCVWVLSLTYASTAYVVSVAAIERHFYIGQEAAILGVTLTVLGFAAGPLLAGPSSELFGRRAVYCVSGVFYSAFSFGAAFANNAAALLIFRFLLGFFGSASINNVPASIGDFTIPLNRATYTSLYSIMAFGGPALGPLCSSFIETDVGFRWNLIVMAIFSTVTSLVVAFVPETHGPTLAKKRQRAELAKSEKEGVAKVEKVTFRTVLGVYKQALKRPVLFFLTEPIVLFISIYLSILYGILYGFFEAFSIVYVEKRGFTATNYGLTYISLGLGFLIGASTVATVGTKAYAKGLKKASERGETPAPESRLVLSYGAAIVSPISLFLFAWTAPFDHVHWIVPCLAELLFAVSMLWIFVSFISYLIDVYLLHAASALAAGMASRALIGSVFPLFALQMYRALSMQGATSLLAGLSLCCAPLPFLFRHMGKKLRAKSSYATSL
ncbi:uncharacterized protein JCM6883_001321 [Sporobolomyces salmoneus]|uniref:uncharacterized protein n=1 Tax=Sporobolomyces salmoneus TaxID=183962 RepID=UPI00317D5385